jgi:hypothetical protein
MPLDLDGNRPIYFHERVANEQRQGYPLHEDVSLNARRRLFREIEARANAVFHGQSRAVPFVNGIIQEIRVVLGNDYFHPTDFATHCPDWPLHSFLTALEISANVLYRMKRLTGDIEVLQSVLRDDLSVFRFRDVGTRPDLSDKFQIQKIDNEHLHREVVDRTFELTRVGELAAAQGDYADAWKHYSKGDLDDAVSNAGKAVESACKAVIKKVDPASTPDNLNLGPLVTLLVQKNVIPSAMAAIATHLEQIYRASGGIRNQAGTGAHGSVHPTTPEESVALLGLRLSGTLISFLAERWLQIK